MDLGVIKEAGIGGGLLSVYSYLILELASIKIDYRTQVIAAFAPAILLVLFIDAMNDPIMKIVAGDSFLKNEVHSKVRGKIGDKRFYYDFEDKQEKIDELDYKSVQKLVIMIVGGFILISFPVVQFTLLPSIELWQLIVVECFVGYILIYRQYLNLQKVIMSLVRLYQQDEN